jgi:hypothetical protein
LSKRDLGSAITDISIHCDLGKWKAQLPWDYLTHPFLKKRVVAKSLQAISMEQWQVFNSMMPYGKWM